jgi:CO/xanthine dehydrogenase Mo-binding subunit
LGLEPQQIRVIAPGVGGGFGVNRSLQPEEVAIDLMRVFCGWHSCFAVCDTKSVQCDVPETLVTGIATT